MSVDTLSAAVANRGVNTAISFVVDRSGSMYSAVESVKTAVSKFIADQKEIPGRATLNLAQFDHAYEVVYSNQNIHEVTPSKFQQEYSARGGTRLYDFFARAIHDMDSYIKSAEVKPKKIVIGLVTDGQDMGSREYDVEKINRLVQEKLNQKWEFIFLGSDRSSEKVAGELGIPKDKAAYFVEGNEQASINLLSQKILGVRKGKPLAITAQEKQILALPNKREL